MVKTVPGDPSVQGQQVQAPPELKEPSRCKVIMHNDDTTPMDFVVKVLVTIFSRPEATAQTIMMRIHHEGTAVCGVYTYEIAETKVAHVMDEARKSHYPLLCSMERL